jgi:formamidopyrimidine-DNA glycosylase
MPELPEVETIRRGLEKELVGHKILNVQVRVPKLLFGSPKDLTDQKILEITRRAKILIWRLENGFVAIHLKMTGQLIFVPKNAQEKTFIGGHPDKLYGGKLPHQYSHIIITFDNGILYFNDLRKFGWIKVLANSEDLKKEVGHLGPEYDWPEFSFDYFQSAILRRAKSPIKQVLLDQTIVAGVGNIYADETLFCAKIQPTRSVGSLTESEINTIYKCIPKVFQLALKYGGTSSRDYRQVDGSQGTYLKVAKVYGRQGLPCRVCGTPILRIKIGARSSHYCPTCQK